MKFILGKKIKMTQVFDKDQNTIIPVTLIKAGPCYVTQIKKQENGKDGYDAIQLGFEELKKRKIKKPQTNKPYKFLREYRCKDSEHKVGQKIDVSIFKQDEEVIISGISKGKGFAGVVKRWGFSDRAKAHGHKDMRKVGSTGSRFPQRVIKGKKMPGRMGSERVTVKNLKIIKIDIENNLMAIKGAMPGNRGTLIEIRSK